MIMGSLIQTMIIVNKCSEKLIVFMLLTVEQKPASLPVSWTRAVFPRGQGESLLVEETHGVSRGTLLSGREVHAGTLET